MQGQVILLLGLSLSLFAQQDRMAPGEPQSTPQASPAAPASAQPWQQCLHALCGDELNRISRELNEYSEVHAVRHAQEFKPLTQAVMAAGVEELLEEKLGMENLVQAVRQDKELTSPRALQLYEITDSLEHFKLIVLNGEGTVDVAASREALKHLPEAARNRTLQGAAVVYETYKNFPAVARESLPVLRQRLTDQEIRKQIVEAIAVIDRDEAAVARHFGLPRDAIFPGVARWDEFKKRLTAEQLDSYDVEQVVERYASPALLTAFIKEFPLSRARQPVKIRSLLSADLLKAVEQRLAEHTAYLAGTAPAGSAAEKALISAGSICYTGAVTVEKYFPTAEDIEKFKPTEKSWRGEYIEKLKTHLSAETMSKVGPFFAGLKIDPPKTREAWMKDVMRDLERIKLEARSEWMQGSEESRQLGVLAYLMNGRSGDTLDKLAEETDDLCLKKGNAVSDESDMSGDRVGVGAMSMKEPKTGRVVAFHEYSHTLSGYIRRGKNISKASREKFDGWRSCLTKAKGGDKRFLEEDFADLLAYNLGGARMDIFCQRDSDSDESSFTTVQTDKEDTHSTRLFRLMHGALIYGQVPPVCMQAVEAKGEKFELSNCMAPK